MSTQSDLFSKVDDQTSLADPHIPFQQTMLDSTHTSIYGTTIQGFLNHQEGPMLRFNPNLNHEHHSTLHSMAMNNNQNNQGNELSQQLKRLAQTQTLNTSSQEGKNSNSTLNSQVMDFDKPTIVDDNSSNNQVGNNVAPSNSSQPTSKPKVRYNPLRAMKETQESATSPVDMSKTSNAPQLAGVFSGQQSSSTSPMETSGQLKTVIPGSSKFAVSGSHDAHTEDFGSILEMLMPGLQDDHPPIEVHQPLYSPEKDNNTAPYSIVKGTLSHSALAPNPGQNLMNGGLTANMGQTADWDATPAAPFPQGAFNQGPTYEELEMANPDNDIAELLARLPDLRADEAQDELALPDVPSDHSKAVPPELEKKLQEVVINFPNGFEVDLFPSRYYFVHQESLKVGAAMVTEDGKFLTGTPGVGGTFSTVRELLDNSKAVYTFTASSPGGQPIACVAPITHPAAAVRNTNSRIHLHVLVTDCVLRHPGASSSPNSSSASTLGPLLQTPSPASPPPNTSSFHQEGGVPSSPAPSHTSNAEDGKPSLIGLGDPTASLAHHASGVGAGDAASVMIGDASIGAQQATGLAEAESAQILAGSLQFGSTGSKVVPKGLEAKLREVVMRFPEGIDAGTFPLRFFEVHGDHLKVDGGYYTEKGFVTDSRARSPFARVTDLLSASASVSLQRSSNKKNLYVYPAKLAPAVPSASPTGGGGGVSAQSAAPPPVVASVQSASPASSSSSSLPQAQQQQLAGNRAVAVAVENGGERGTGGKATAVPVRVSTHGSSVGGGGAKAAVLPATLEEKMLRLMKMHPQGLPGPKFQQLYAKMYGRPLDFDAFGYKKLSELFAQSTVLKFIKNESGGMVYLADQEEEQISSQGSVGGITSSGITGGSGTTTSLSPSSSSAPPQQPSSSSSSLAAKGGSWLQIATSIPSPPSAAAAAPPPSSAAAVHQAHTQGLPNKGVSGGVSGVVVPLSLERVLLRLLRRHPGGIPGKNFQPLFQDATGRPLDFHSFGFSKLSDFFQASRVLCFKKNASSGMVHLTEGAEELDLSDPPSSLSLAPPGSFSSLGGLPPQSKPTTLKMPGVQHPQQPSSAALASSYQGGGGATAPGGSSAVRPLQGTQASSPLPYGLERKLRRAVEGALQRAGGQQGSQPGSTRGRGVPLDKFEKYYNQVLGEFINWKAVPYRTLTELLAVSTAVDIVPGQNGGSMVVCTETVLQYVSPHHKPMPKDEEVQHQAKPTTASATITALPIPKVVNNGVSDANFAGKTLPKNQKLAASNSSLIDPEDMECPVCLHGYCTQQGRVPCTSQCGHTICELCLYDIRVVNNMCPQCRMPFPRNVPHNITLIKIATAYNAKTKA